MILLPHTPFFEPGYKTLRLDLINRIDTVNNITGHKRSHN